MPNDCPDVLWGWHSHPLARDGRCLWCGRIVGPPVPMPARWTRYQHSTLWDAWRRAYDPDWGSGAYDRDPA